MNNLSNLPPGVTNEMIERAMGVDVPLRVINAVQEIIEDRAENDIRTCSPIFTDWCADNEGNSWTARLLSLASMPDPYAFNAYRDQLFADYKAYRVDFAQEGLMSEWETEISRLMEDA